VLRFKSEFSYIFSHLIRTKNGGKKRISNISGDPIMGQPRLAETRLAECPFGRNPFGRNPFGRIDPTGRKIAENFTKMD
jgi:hypothetical protein